MGNTMRAQDGWKFRHIDATDVSSDHINVALPDARGLQLRIDCGYTWAMHPSCGWIQVSILLREAKISEAVGTGYNLSDMRDRAMRREMRLRKGGR